MLSRDFFRLEMPNHNILHACSLVISTVTRIVDHVNISCFMSAFLFLANRYVLVGTEQEEHYFSINVFPYLGACNLLYHQGQWFLVPSSC
jgi:hypothetical protein